MRTQGDDVFLIAYMKPKKNTYIKQPKAKKKSVNVNNWLFDMAQKVDRILQILPTAKDTKMPPEKDDPLWRCVYLIHS